MGSSAPVRGERGVAGAVTTLHDITDLKEADRALHELVSELATVTAEAVRRADELDSILSSIGEPVVVFDREGDPMRANPGFKAFFGFDPLGLSGPELHRRLCDRAERTGSGIAEAAVREALGGVPLKDREQETTDGRGSPRTMLVSCSPILSGGKPAGAVCSWHDITDRKKAEGEIMYLASFPDLAPIPVLEFDSGGELTFENAAATKVLEILGTTDPSGILPAAPASLLERLKGRKHESVYGEVTIGERIYGENIYTPEGTDRLRVYAIDITDEKRMEASLQGQQRELESRNSQLQALFDYSAASLALFDARPPYTVLAHNKYYQRLWTEPFRSQGLVGKNLFDYVPGAEVQGVKAVYDEVVRSKKAKNLVNFPYDGLERGRTWWNWHLSPIMKGDEVIALAHVAFDVTNENLARQKAEETARMLEKANERLACQAEILANVHDAIFATGPDLTITFWNRAAEKIYGWKAEEAVGQNSGDLLRASAPGSTREEILKKLLADGRWSGEIVQRRKDSRPVTVEANAIATRDPAGNVTGILTVNRDISGRKRAGEER